MSARTPYGLEFCDLWAHPLSFAVRKEGSVILWLVCFNVPEPQAISDPNPSCSIPPTLPVPSKLSRTFPFLVPTPTLSLARLLAVPLISLLPPSLGLLLQLPPRIACRTCGQADGNLVVTFSLDRYRSTEVRRVRHDTGLLDGRDKYTG